MGVEGLKFFWYASETQNHILELHGTLYVNFCLVLWWL